MLKRICSVFVKLSVVPIFVVVAAAGGCGGGGNGDGAAGNPNPCVVGVDGWCWSVYEQPSTTAAWVTPPSATSVHAYLTSTTQPNSAGAYFFSPGDMDLTRFDRIIFTATASSGFGFGVAGGHSDVGCGTNFSGNGTSTTYTYEFSKCSLWSTNPSEPPFSFARANQFTWQTVWEMASSLDIEIVPDILFCLGTQCTANPLSP